MLAQVEKRGCRSFARGQVKNDVFKTCVAFLGTPSVILCSQQDQPVLSIVFVEESNCATRGIGRNTGAISANLDCRLSERCVLPHRFFYTGTVDLAAGIAFPQSL